MLNIKTTTEINKVLQDIDNVMLEGIVYWDNIPITKFSKRQLIIIIGLLADANDESAKLYYKKKGIS